MSVETVVVSGSSSPNEEKPESAVMLYLGELKGLMESLKESLGAMAPTVQAIHAQTTEILSLAEVIEEATEETAETVDEIAEAVEEVESESEEEENQNPQVEVEIPPAPSMIVEVEPEKPENKVASILRKSLLG